MGKKYWIQGAVDGKDREGNLRDWSKEHHLMNQDGTIDLRRAHAYVERNYAGAARTLRLRQIALATNLRHLHHR